MTDLITFLRSYDYAICLAKGNWILDEAVDYLAAYLVNKETCQTREDAYQEFVSIRDQLLSAVKQSVDAGRLLIDEVYEAGGLDEAGKTHDVMDIKKATVIPYVFISWAIDNDIKVPKQFAQYLTRKKEGKSGRYETLGLKRSTIHHERCRAVAELLWSIDPDITITDMARRSEIIQFGCEGQKYDMRTISRWLASLKVDRKPGNPKKRKV